MTTRIEMLAALDALREVDFSAYCQVTSGQWIAAYALEDANADYWHSADAAQLLADVKDCVSKSQDGAR